LRVADIQRRYELWRSRGAKFITKPKVHRSEKRCCMRDPDGYLIEVGQTTLTKTPLDCIPIELVGCLGKRNGKKCNYSLGNLGVIILATPLPSRIARIFQRPD
jgi:hypothetical protein